ncbi:LysR family transcriptional regulator [Tardiphaga sp. 538_B7_N1_4]|nr:LysR family transcriptional regulator [Bradyrhizobium diazoefficiens]MBR0967317.1 LysR family transcriptional regulator [Bradyrhizobium diazoefficiens]MBR0976638.1 LysR family transcriptional regulator [Bradyrhizobium diazoefficiens]MBR1005283.1 LysR family transcriptional regulator [Bradyrhizobium diazoefficiens]MBR1011756.1 LysR family transcriptional regulator [Bradyrhizobium diazoefficiens]MBR1049097.1 LysR family transcriptional regulator [Bradyrhizobium diazoefficiens]
MKKKKVAAKHFSRTSAPTLHQAERATSRKRLRPPRTLVYIDAVARHGSIRKAAEVLHVASSALNRQILALEMDLGAALFERLPRGVRLTSAGEVFLVYARLVISELKVAESRIEQLHGLVHGQVNVAAAESVAGELLPSAITKFQAAHPKVRFHVRIGAPEELVEALIADQVDLILTHDAPRKKDVAIVAVARQALCAMVIPDHPLAGREELRLRDCLAFPLALADKTLAGRGLIEQVLARASFDLEPRLVSNSVEAMKAFAHMNRGVCFQFRSPGKALIPPGDMIALPLVDPPLLQARLFLATRRDRVLPVAAAAFVEQLKSAFA